MNTLPSISRRLITYLCISLPALWLLTALFSAVSIFHEINEAGDTQLSQLARSLLQVPLAQHAAPTVAVLTLTRQQSGLIDADEMGFSVWNAQGRMLVSDIIGTKIPYKNQYRGFVDHGRWWQKKAWRVFYLENPQTGIRVAVSASRRERLKTVMRAVWAQLGMSLLFLPILLWLIVWGVRRGMQPLRALAEELNQRDAQSLMPVNSLVPKEIQPPVAALNALLARVDSTVKREQRFTADAAHELRSPLAAMEIQAEVLALDSESDEQQQRIRIIRNSIDHTTHLINQLLILSKLDPLLPPHYTQPVDWQKISDEALQSVNLSAREKHIRLQRLCCGADWHAQLPLCGDEMLLVILLRNLLDNAVRYSPDNGLVTLHFFHDRIVVENQGKGVEESCLHHLRERFFRPPGQVEKGSGLGLSIVDSIARLHHLTMMFDNKKNQDGEINGFIVMLRTVI